MIVKIFGKTDNQLSRYLSEKTFSEVKSKVNTLDKVYFYDLDKPIGSDLAKDLNIFYLPTVIIENEVSEEIDCIECNKSIYDINMSHVWWTDLELFLQKNFYE